MSTEDSVMPVEEAAGAASECINCLVPFAAPKVFAVRREELVGFRGQIVGFLEQGVGAFSKLGDNRAASGEAADALIAAVVPLKRIIVLLNGWDGSQAVPEEMKGLSRQCLELLGFPPGTRWDEFEMGG